MLLADGEYLWARCVNVGLPHEGHAHGTNRLLDLPRHWRCGLSLLRPTSTDGARRHGLCEAAAPSSSTLPWGPAMIPAQFPESNQVLAMGQEDYEPMPIHRSTDGRVTCCFRLSPAELEEIARTRTLWIQVLTFNHPFQPIALSTQRPADLPSQEPTS